MVASAAAKVRERGYPHSMQPAAHGREREREILYTMRVCHAAGHGDQPNRRRRVDLGIRAWRGNDTRGSS